MNYKLKKIINYLMPTRLSRELKLYGRLGDLSKTSVTGPGSNASNKALETVTCAHLDKIASQHENQDFKLIARNF